MDLPRMRPEEVVTVANKNEGKAVVVVDRDHTAGYIAESLGNKYMPPFVSLKSVTIIQEKPQTEIRHLPPESIRSLVPLDEVDKG